MLGNIITIAILYLRKTYTERGVFIFQLVMPLAFIFVIGQGTSGFGGDGPIARPLYVVNEDAGPLGDVFVDHLRDNEAILVEIVDRTTAVTAVEEDDDIAAALFIPEQFSTDLRQETTVPIDFYTNPNSVTQVQAIEQAVLTAVGQLSGSLIVADVNTSIANSLGRLADEQSQNAYYDEALLKAGDAWESPPLSVRATLETRLASPENDIPVGVNQSSPGITVMFAMFSMLAGVVTLVQERDEGTLRRLLVMPIQKATILLGKMSGIYFTGLIQMAILILAGYFLFNVNWGQSPVAMLLMVISFAFTITSLGMMMAALVRTQAQANSLNTVIVLAMSSLGGAWWPLDIVPEWMQTVGHLTPVAWAMDGFQDIITRGFGIAEILPEVGILLAYGVVFLAIGVWRFRYE